MSFDRFSFRFSALILGLFLFAAPVWAQSSDNNSKAQDSDKKQVKSKQDEVDPLKRPLTQKQKERNSKALKIEIGQTYKKWLNEDVRYIITPEEEQTFKQLSNDEERDVFIENFWLRRDPTPDTPENEFKEEHYRRIAYANEHFAAGIPGWRSDRGRMYIQYGPPDEIESHPSGGTYQRPMDEGGGSTSTYPFEDWRWRYIEGIGQEVIVEFVDTCQCGDYHMTMDRSEKDALLMVPNAGLTFSEEMGMTSKNDRFTHAGLERLGLDPGQQGAQSGKEFDRLEQFFKLQRPPQIKFKELDEIVTHKIRYNLMPFDVRSDFVKVTSDTVLVPVTVQVQNKHITFENKDGVARGLVNIYGRVTTMTEKIAQTFEDTVGIDVPGELLEKTMQNHSIYWKALPLRPGRYRMDIVVKDVKGDRVGTWTKALTVPDFGDEKLASSTLILADVMEKVPSKSVGAGNFVIGDTKVRPRVEHSDGKPASFKREQRMNFWMQVYNLGIDGQSKKPSATIEYDVVNTATNKPVAHMVETTEQMGKVGEQITLERSMPLTSLPPGTYRLTIKVNDNISKQTITPSANFVVE